MPILSSVPIFSACFGDARGHQTCKTRKSANSLVPDFNSVGFSSLRPSAVGRYLALRYGQVDVEKGGVVRQRRCRDPAARGRASRYRYDRDLDRSQSGYVHPLVPVLHEQIAAAGLATAILGNQLVWAAQFPLSNPGLHLALWSSASRCTGQARRVVAR